MITIVNFGHPLSAEARDYIAQEWSGDQNVDVVDVRVQIDFAAPIAPQCEQIAVMAETAVGGNPLNVDCVVLPGLAVVAAYLARRFPRANIIVISPVPGATPPRFMPSELIRATQPIRDPL